MKTKILLEFEGYPLVVAHFWGEENEPMDVVLNCPHGYEGKEFLQYFSFLCPLFAHIEPEDFARYLSLEADFGSRALAFSLGRQLQKKKNGVLLEVRCDRGIMDANRLEEYCVRRIFDHDLHPHSVEILQKMNTEIAEHTLRFCREHLSRRGTFFDVHSMWPTSQILRPGDFEREDQIPNYIFALLDPKNQRQKRIINTLLCDENDIIRGDAEKTTHLEEVLEENGFPVERDSPYRLLTRIRSTFYYQFFSGVSFDIPRDLLGDIQKTQSPFLEWTLNPKKIEHLANVISRAII